jgi:hypothetical protein
VIFLYDAWNREHIAKHGVNRADAEYVVESAAPPYPRKKEDDKFLVWGPDPNGRIIEVVFAVKVGKEIDFETVSFEDLDEISGDDNAMGIYIIHAMPLDGRRLKQYRRNRR